MLAYVSGAPAWRGRVQCHTTMAQVQSTKIPLLRQETNKDKQGFVLAFRKTRVQILLYVLLNASVIAKNNSLDCFCTLLFKSLLFSVVQNKNKRTSRLMSFYFGGKFGV